MLEHLVKDGAAASVDIHIERYGLDAVAGIIEIFMHNRSVEAL